MKLRVQDFSYDLPQELIAQAPVSPRDSARLLVVDRQTEKLIHLKIRDLAEWLTPNDVLVVNQTRVFPARLNGQKLSGGKVEILLLKELQDGLWEALSKPGLKAGTEVRLTQDLQVTVIRKNNDEGVLRIKFQSENDKVNIHELIERVGKVPLPPYIHSLESEKQLKEDYQTVYAKDWGSAAAPTAGLHFTKPLLGKLKAKGVEIIPLTLHVGLGTFQPVTQESIDRGSLHTESLEITSEAAKQILVAKHSGKRILAVGTTTTRALESAARLVGGELTIDTGWQETDLFIKPPYQFKVVDSLITNFHLPHSSLLMLVSAMVSAPNTQEAFKVFPSSLMGRVYQTAVKEKYRFFSFGDAMWIK